MKRDDGCLTENEIIDRVRGDVPLSGDARVERHISDCSACRMLVAEAAKSSLTPWSSSHVPTHPPVDLPESAPTLRITRTSNAVLAAVASSDDPDMLIGRVVAKRFRVERLLGAGGMGRVYQAFDELLNVRLAMKLIRPELARRDALLKLLYRELVVARRVNHPNVCRVYDIGLEDGLHFFTMELVDGQTLDDARRGGLPTERVHDYLLQIARALEAAHAAGVIHRDLKPGNVMVDTKGRVTVMDFGLARDQDDSSILRGPVGTPAYWAPEQANGEQVTPATDVYAFGVVALRLFGLNGHDYEGIEAAPVHYREFLARCLAASPADRFRGGRELRATLESLTSLSVAPTAVPSASGASNASNVTGPVTSLHPPRVVSWPLRIGVLVGVLALSFVGGMFAFRGSASSSASAALPPPSVAPLPLASASSQVLPVAATASPPAQSVTAIPSAAASVAAAPATSSDGGGARRKRAIPTWKPPASTPTIPVLE